MSRSATWSEEMDRKAKEMVKDPEGYFAKARLREGGHKSLRSLVGGGSQEPKPRRAK